MASERVKTYRVLRDGLRHGYSVRNFGDFLPEAKALPTLRSLLNTNIIEEVWVDQEEFDEWKVRQEERDKALAEGIDPDDVDEDVDEDEDDADTEPAPPVAKAKKKVTKKTTAKKTVKKGKNNGAKLAEQRV